jgi:flagellar basal-body rod protein FlgF
MENITTIALSRLVAQSRALDVRATNIANANTPGFKAERTLFTASLTPEPNRAEPPGGRVLAYTQDRATWRDTRASSRQHTGNPLDIAIGNDAGWLTVMTNQGPRLTRAGHFALLPDGTIADEQGNALLDVNGRRMQVSPADGQLNITADGALSGDNGQIGTIGVVQPANTTGLTAEGGHLFASAAPTSPLAQPQLVQGALEESNVQPIVEMSDMMDDLREYQLTSQMIQAESDRQNGAIEKIMAKGS